MKNIKWKEFLLEKGEIVGLAAAGALAVLLLVLTLVPRLFIGGAQAHAKELNELSAKLKRAQENASPRDEHKPGPVGDAIKEYQPNHVDASEYPTLLAFFPPIEKDRKRQKPSVLVPEEFQVAFYRAQLPQMVLVPNEEGKYTKVWVLKNAAGAEGGPPGMPAGMTIGKGGFGSGSMGQFGPPGAMGMGGQRTLRGLRQGFGRRGRKPIDLTDKIELVDIATAEGRSLATQALAQRMILVEASFPYKRQVQEFMEKLRLPNHGAVLNEQVKGKDNETWPAFEFRGLVIERTTLDRNGKEGAWERLLGKIKPNEKVERQPFDLEQVYKALLVQLPPQFRQEKEDEKLQAILGVSIGLVAPVPAQYDREKTPKLEEKLTKIQETITKLGASGKKTENVTPTLIKVDDPFNKNARKQRGTGGVTGGTTGTEGTQGTTVKETPIDYCLIRFVDPSAEAGKTYKYRIKVKMANPNYSPDPEKRTDTYPQFAQSEELVAAEWATSPPVSVPSDEFLYAVDQAKVAPKLRVGFNTPRDHQTVFQIHRWVDSYPTPANTEQGVGDWLVAERFFVDRGEFVRTPPYFTLKVPVHRLDNPNLTLDSRPAVRRGQRTDQIPLTFGDESILVDFDGGDRILHIRTETKDEKTTSTRVEDKAALEVLIMRPDGRMVARNSVTDSGDEVRTKRYKDYLERVKEATEGKKKPGGTGAFDTP